MKEEQIREAVARRDHEAMEWVMNNYAGLLWKIIYSILHNASTEEIEECVADTFFSFWQNPLSFQPERSSLKNYLATIAKHKAIDRYRKWNRRSEISYEESIHFVQTEDTLSKLISKERQLELEQAIESFPEPDREILKRRLYEGQKPLEISEALSLHVRQVNNKIYRSKQWLRKWWLQKK
ncbi:MULTISPECIES: sigma-70 family RNA polymerase sigma factor [unclassified Paenibacillus]|uniref:sigma-70 family RNA polymerase sigma factor n=1 Tax=unclassified Paenibacillus TaxID=185978 RepID=UPI0009D4D565|nr:MULTISPECIES: sigma-70 family RNA polymerase sigma factor [unclassified Paenibacillus]SLK09102.1 RNA polymerase sigma factor, sigma-70 family [Paenibacillus sp. RU5A]SOC71394.1 RNA polymerase sigma factor, sigma-70 family [Paenibacillus sp. RU26A]SOC73842.1 RNA polymerase sigma factor, sigma-70 family [Paenibacillus sp. RU5M]